MPFEIYLGNPPAGHALEGARAEGDSVLVQFREFTSSEDGLHFLSRLEGFPNEVLQKYKPAVAPSQVDHMLGIFRRDGTATIHLNELTLIAEVRPTGAVKKGDPVSKDDIAELDRLDVGVDVPNDAGVLFLFSIGWRKGLFYDFGPASGPSPVPREYDLSSVFGQAYCHVLFQDRFGISDLEWQTLLDQKWFPFVGLPNSTMDRMLSYVRSGWDVDEMLSEITDSVKSRVSVMLEAWRSHAVFEPHLPLLEQAIERFLADDHVSCTSILFPRIEGLMRTYHASLGVAEKCTSGVLVNRAVSTRIDTDKCLLLPHRFAEYLRTVYFAAFNPAASEIDVSRHSVAHGVASANQFDNKSAVIGLLVTQQLAFFLTAPKRN